MTDMPKPRYTDLTKMMAKVITAKHGLSVAITAHATRERERREALHAKMTSDNRLKIGPAS